MDDRLFLYYFIFVGGIVTNKLIKNWTIFSNKKIILVLAITIGSTFVYVWGNGKYYFFNSPAIDFVIRQILVFDIAIISGCIFLLFLLNRHHVLSVLKKCELAITFLAISSYCVYLFHFQIFTIGAGLVDFLKLPAIVNELLFYTLIIPITFVISYYIQVKEKDFMNKLKVYYSSIALRKKNNSLSERTLPVG